MLGYHVPPPPRAAPVVGTTVFVTMGTVFNTESGDLLRTAALGAAGCPGVRDVVVATGEHLDPLKLQPLPRNVSVHQFVDQDALLARSGAVATPGRAACSARSVRRCRP